MIITQSNISGLVTLTEHCTDKQKQEQTARELLEALETLHGLRVGFKEAYRQRLEKLLKEPAKC